MSDNTTESERYLKMSDLKKQSDKRYPLWLFFAQEHDLSLTESQLDDIVHAVKKHLANETPKGNGESSPLEGIVRRMSDDLIEELKRTKNLRNSDDERLVEAGKAMMPKEGQEYWIRLECENAELLQAVFNSMFKNKDGSSSYVFGAKLEEIFFGSPKQKFIRDYLQQKLNEID